MTKQTVLVGVDASDASATAAKIGCELAEAAGDECQLVHFTADVSKMPATVPPIEDMDELMDRVQAAARRDVRKALRGYVSEFVTTGAYDELTHSGCISVTIRGLWRKSLVVMVVPG